MTVSSFKGLFLTKFQRYGTNINAIPAETLLAPTPKFLITVGNSSAVNTGMTALLELTLNLPAWARAVLSHCMFEETGRNGTKRVSRQAHPANANVRHNGHLRPPRRIIKILAAIDGSSTTPVKT